MFVYKQKMRKSLKTTPNEMNFHSKVLEKFLQTFYKKRTNIFGFLQKYKHFTNIFTKILYQFLQTFLDFYKNTKIQICTNGTKTMLM